jgi:hypothetical protein
MDEWLIKKSDKIGEYLQEEKGVVLPLLLIFTRRAAFYMVSCWIAIIIFKAVTAKDGIDYFGICLGLFVLTFELLVVPIWRREVKNWETAAASWDEPKTRETVQKQANLNRHTEMVQRLMSVAFFLNFIFIDVFIFLALGWGDPGLDSLNLACTSMFLFMSVHNYARTWMPKAPNRTVKEFKPVEARF